MKPIHWLLGGAAALGLGYLIFHKTARFKGDNAKPGDDVRIPVTSLAGQLPAALPQGAGFVQVRVDTVAPDTLDGYVTSYVIQEAGSPLFSQPIPLAQPVGPVRVQRKDVVTVLRANQLVA